ncbi:MAG: ROK family transcriptional regulator [Deinococcota bacterium]|nr:ROK family transcriptional regulator [Deinococcota bacterium]
MNVTQRILELIRHQGPLSRAEIARRLGVSKPTVSAGVQLLLGAGLVREGGYAESEGGRRAILIDFNAEAGFVIGMDVGGSAARAALADLQGRVLASHQEPTGHGDAAALLAQLGGIKRRLTAQIGVDERRVLAVAVGTPGVIDPVLGMVRYAPNLPALEDPAFIHHIGEALGEQVSLENDVNMATLGEQWQGAGQGLSDFVFVSIGTGLGLGLMMDGRLYRGTAGRAGEFGYAPLLGQPDSNLEELLCGPTLARRHREAGGGGSPEEAFDEALAGRQPGKGVIEGFLEHLSLALATLASLLDPQAIILGGGVGSRCAPFLGELHAKLARLSPILPPLAVSTLRGEAGIYGALAVALQESRPLTLLEGGGEKITENS